MRSAELPRVPQCIAENQPAFGVGVDDLDSFARGTLQDVAGPDRSASRHVLRDGDDPDHADRRFQLGQRANGTRDSRSAGHVVFHPIHIRSRLDGDAARVERDALTDKAEHRRFWGAGRVVPDRDQPRRLRAAAPHTEKHAHAEALELVMIEHVRQTVRHHARFATRRSANVEGVSVFPGSLSSWRAMLQCSPITRPRRAASRASRSPLLAPLANDNAESASARRCRTRPSCIVPHRTPPGSSPRRWPGSFQASPARRPRERRCAQFSSAEH